MSKKAGLAKLAKTISLSTDINEVGLQDEEEERKEGDNVIVVPLSSNVPSVLLTSPNSISDFEGDQNDSEVENSSETVSQGTSQPISSPVDCVTSKQKEWIIGSDSEEGAGTVSSSGDETVQSDSSTSEVNKDVADSADQGENKPGGFSRFIDSIHRRTFRRKKKSYPSDSEPGSPFSSSDRGLKVPVRVGRSRSMSRIPDAFQKVNSVCVLPAKTAPKKAKSASNSRLLTSSYYQSLNKPTYRKSKVPLETKSHVKSVSSTPFKPFRKCHSYSNTLSLIKQKIGSRDTQSLPYGGKINERNKRKLSIRKMKIVSRNKIKDQSAYSSSSVDSLTASNGSVLSKSFQDSLRMTNDKSLINQSSNKESASKASSWYTFDQPSSYYSDDASNEDIDSSSRNNEEEDDDLDDLPLHRSFSLTNLRDVNPPLGHVRLADARHKGNYLFGGLGSLLGPTELDRYFPERNMVVFIATWNMNGKEPPQSLDDFLLPDNMQHLPDLYVIGTQESGGDRTEWEVRLQTTIGPSHVLFHSAMLGILHLTLFLRRDLIWFCSVPEESYYSLRPGTYFKTKGAIAISFQFFGTKILFINTHLFAHEEHLSQRIQNYKNIVYNLDLPRNLRGMKLNKSKDVTNRFDVVFWMGDLNFRLVGPRDQMIEKIKEFWTKRADFSELLEFDQLTQVKRNDEAFHGFDEARITFAPTFKFDVGTNRYDTSYKQRVPSYTDRILYKSLKEHVHCTYYNSCLLFKTSDHKPVCGVFNFKLRPGKDDVPLAAGQFRRDVYLAALKRRRRFFHQASSKNCQMQ